MGLFDKFFDGDSEILFFIILFLLLFYNYKCGYYKCGTSEISDAK